MAQTVSLKPIGPAQVLSVANANAGPITLAAFNDGEAVNFAAFLNTGATIVAIQMGQKGTTPNATFPAVGTPSNCFILPASMQMPIVVPTPRGPFDVNMFGSAAGPSLVYAWPVGPQ